MVSSARTPDVRRRLFPPGLRSLHSPQAADKREETIMIREEVTKLKSNVTNDILNSNTMSTIL